MTLLSETNTSIVKGEYDGNNLNIVAMNDDNGKKIIAVTKLSADDIKDLISRRSSEKSLEDRLKSDYKCNYNFKSPPVNQHRGYAKRLLESLKSADLIMPSPIRKIRVTKRRGKKRPKKTRSRGRPRSKKTKRREKKSARKRTKTIKYTPFPSQSYTRPHINEPRDTTIERRIPINKIDTELPNNIQELITNASKNRVVNN